jgi:hypothetical protein
MESNDPLVLALRRKVHAAHEEFDAAMAYHEAWKPAAYDEALHKRMGRSHATNTFLVVRQALRREMLLGLARLWDSDSRAVGMEAIAKSLRDQRIVDVLATEREAHWSNMQPLMLDLPDNDQAREEVIKSIRLYDADVGREQSCKLRQSVSEAITIISDYAKGGSRYATRHKLITLRNEHLAHRQVSPSEEDSADTTNADIETFYQDISKLIQLLRACVEGTSYNHEENAKIHRRNAGHFWAGVSGELTEGHPNYRADKSQLKARIDRE